MHVKPDSVGPAVVVVACIALALLVLLGIALKGTP